MDKQRPIGVFDSGLGGLTVLKEIIKELPNEDLIYFGDTARVPYGPRSSETVTKYTFQSINFLLSKGVKAVVIACNTATARSLLAAQEKYPNLPIVGVIEAGARTLAQVTKSKKVGVIGTDGTINSKAYQKEICKLDSEISVIGRACPLFVPIVEEGWSDTEIAEMTARRYLQVFKKEHVDSLVLGCTHYPLLTRTIAKVVGPGMTLVNPARETARDLKKFLLKADMMNYENDSPKYQYYVSDAPERFKEIGSRFLREPINKIDIVEIQKY